MSAVTRRWEIIGSGGEGVFRSYWRRLKQWVKLMEKSAKNRNRLC